jgi:hypothetical protein
MNKLTATTRIGREVPRVRRERYPDDERSQHCDDSGEHRPIIRLNSGASNSPVTVRSPTVCCAQIIQHRKLGMEFIHFSDKFFRLMLSGSRKHHATQLVDTSRGGGWRDAMVAGGHNRTFSAFRKSRKPTCTRFLLLGCLHPLD